MSKFKFIKQMDQKDCGAACLAMILQNYGSQVPLYRLRKYSGTDREGTSAFGLTKCLERYGFDCLAVQANSSAWTDDQVVYPSIAHIQLEDGFLHYVVVYGCESNTLLIADPAQGKQKISISDFEKIWTGILLLPKPNKRYKVVIEKTALITQYLPILWQNRALLLKISILSTLIILINIATSFYLQAVIDYVVDRQQCHLLTTLSIGLIIGQISLAIFERIRDLLLVYYGHQMSQTMILNYFKHVLYLPMEFYATRLNGDIISRFLDANKIIDALGSTSLSLILDVSMVLVVGTILLVQHRMLFLITLSSLPLYLFTILFFIDKQNKANEAEMTQGSKLNSNIVESLNGIETIKANNGEILIYDRISKSFDKYISKSYNRNKLEIKQHILKKTISLINMTLTIWVGSYFVLAHKLSLGQLMTYQALVIYFTEPLQNIINLQAKIQTANIANLRMNEVLDIKRENNVKSSSVSISDFSGINAELVIQNLDFAYNNRSEVLKNVNFTVPHLSKTAIVGQSGSGKSTLAKILVAFYDIEEGTVTYGGKCINQINKIQLRNSITYIPQESFLFHGTLYENLTFGLNKTPTTEKIKHVLDIVGLTKFINSQIQKLDMGVEENGSNLSGGQKQRIALARALLRDSDVYILDEATSAMDPLLEKKILKSLINMDKTFIFIAHHLSSITSCDQIILLDQGEVKDVGTHEKLYKSNTLYHNLYDAI